MSQLVPAVGASERVRRALQVSLGALWIFDGVLQAQPSLSTPDFFGMMLRMGPAEPPSWLWNLESRFEPFVTTHAWGSNVAFAVLQLVIGVGICWRRTTRIALRASIIWALGVWLFGEAAGGLFSPGASALTGAPGAALLYALLSLLVWPPRHADAPASGAARRLPELAWSTMWLGMAALQWEALNRSGFIVGAMISNVAYTAPGAFAGADRAVSVFAAGHGLLFCALLAGAQIVVALGIWVPRARRPVLVLAIVVAAFFGVVGQNLGGIFSNGFTGVLESGATDPGSGPILVLVALALWPSLVRIPAATPAQAVGFRTWAARLRLHATSVLDVSPHLAADGLPPELSRDGGRPGESRPARLVSP